MKHSNWLLQFIGLVLTNQSALFQRSIVMQLKNNLDDLSSLSSLIPSLFSFIFIFSTQLKFCIKICRWLDLNRRTLM